jgi:hypothetical protein
MWMCFHCIPGCRRGARQKVQPINVAERGDGALPAPVREPCGPIPLPCARATRESAHGPLLACPSRGGSPAVSHLTNRQQASVSPPPPGSGTAVDPSPGQTRMLALLSEEEICRASIPVPPGVRSVVRVLHLVNKSSYPSTEEQVPVWTLHRTRPDQNSRAVMYALLYVQVKSAETNQGVFSL